jgi:hypothetical protein
MAVTSLRRIRSLLFDYPTGVERKVVSSTRLFFWLKMPKLYSVVESENVWVGLCWAATKDTKKANCNHQFNFQSIPAAHSGSRTV